MTDLQMAEWVQEAASIAAGIDTAMADAMLVACAKWSYVHGLAINVPRERMRGAVVRVVHTLVIDGDDATWRRFVERNSDTRWQHV